MALASYDKRHMTAHPVACRKTSVVLDYSEAAASIESDIVINGRIGQIYFTIPALDGSNTAELKLHDADDNEIYASGEKAESTTHVLDVDLYVCQTITIRIETSGDQTADRTFVVTMYFM